jgi:hypothetical protein
MEGEPLIRPQLDKAQMEASNFPRAGLLARNNLRIGRDLGPTNGKLSRSERLDTNEKDWSESM